MSVSISTIADRIGLQRRKISALQKGRQEAYAALDKADGDLLKIQAKYTDGGEGGEPPSEPSAEDVKAMADLEAEIVANRKKIVEANDAIAKQEDVLAELEEDKANRELHNRTEERLNASAGRSVNPDNLAGAAGASSQIQVLPLTAEQLDHDISCIIKCIALAKGDESKIPALAAGKFGNDRVSAAMQTNTFTAGGAFVPDQYMPRLIEGLFSRTIVRGMGIPTIPVEFGSLEMPRITSGATAGYTGEGQDADETSVGTDRVRLVPKELIGLLPFSNMLLAQSSPGADSVLRNQLSIGVGLAEDRAFLRGTPAGAGPTGLRYLAAAANIIASSPASAVAPTSTETDEELGLLELALIGSDVPMISPYWLMAPRTFIYLLNLRDANGFKAYPELSLAQPMLRGKPVRFSTVIPTNLSTDKSEIYLVDASQQIIGENPRISIGASDVASYVDANGNTVSAFARNETVLRTVIYNDINTQHSESIAVLTDVRWGA